MLKINRLQIKNPDDFNLEQIFECGQCFRWDRESDGSYTGVVSFFANNKLKNIVANVRQVKDALIIESSVEDESFSTDLKWDAKKFWEEYFDFDTNYGEIKAAFIKRDKRMKEIIEHGKGIRILNQNKWEMLISFIISQNNHIPRIKSCIETLCKIYGKDLGEFRGLIRYGFPEPEVLANLSLEEFDICKLGYRNSYILESAKQIIEVGMESYLEMELLPEAKAREILKTFKGVGNKVANCILLFGFKKRKSFPVDVHIKRIMEEIYGVKGEKEINVFVAENFGEYGGIAQQYLFYFNRERTKDVIQ